MYCWLCADVAQQTNPILRLVKLNLPHLVTRAIRQKLPLFERQFFYFIYLDIYLHICIFYCFFCLHMIWSNQVYMDDIILLLSLWDFLTIIQLSLLSAFRRGYFFPFRKIINHFYYHFTLEGYAYDKQFTTLFSTNSYS